MYDSLGLAALKEDAMEVGAAAVGTVAGIGVAKFVTDKAKDMLTFTGGQYVNALIPVAVGLGVYTLGAQKMGRGAARDAVSGVAAGMVAFGIGKLVASFSATAGAATGLALGSVYDYSLNGDFGPGDVSAYMMNGAPVSFESMRALNAAPVDIQTVTPFNGAPTSATVINTNAPLSAALVA